MPSPLEQLAEALLSQASGLRDQAIRLQEVTMGALGLPTSNEVERMERRIRSLTDTVSDLEGQIDRLESKIAQQDDTK